MKAITIIPGNGAAQITCRPEPVLQRRSDVKLRVIEVGICHTDHDLLRGFYGRVPQNQEDLVIGHEMIGQVTEIGPDITQLGVGDYAVCTIRRACEECVPCKMNRADMCLTGAYLSRGITGLDGFNCEWVVEDEKYVIKVPEEIAHFGAIIEPCAVAEKAISEAHAVAQARIPGSVIGSQWFYGRRCLVAGLGTVGLLVSMLLLMKGAVVYGLDIQEVGARRPQWLLSIGGTYLRGNQGNIDQLFKDVGPIDLIFEATGVASLEFELAEMLARNGIYVLM
ncbi:MAG: alcohol dehydrogenase catalytic domain-containing protein, partial [Ktedonobacteraceae bacterium]